MPRGVVESILECAPLRGANWLQCDFGVQPQEVPSKRNHSVPVKQYNEGCYGQFLN